MIEKPTRGAVSAAVDQPHAVGEAESQDQSIRRSIGSSKQEQIRSMTLSSPNLSQ